MAPLVKLDLKDLMKLELLDDEPALKEPPQFWTEKYNFSLDGHAAVGIPVPASDQEKEELVKRFLKGLEKELTKEGNWTFLQQVLLSLDYCAKCGACEEACPIYLASGMWYPVIINALFHVLICHYLSPDRFSIGKSFLLLSSLL